MLTILLSLVGYCRHRRIGTPVTLIRGGATTVWCSDCGQRVEYDLNRMRTGAAVLERASPSARLQEGE